MEYLTPELRKISAINLPGDIRQRMKRPDVKELSVSIANLGGRPAQLPTLRGPDIGFGRDRIAACMLLGQDEIWIQPVKCDDVELLLLEMTENLHRRSGDNVDRLRTGYVDTLAKLLDARVKAEGEKKPSAKKKEAKPEKDAGGRPKEARTIAREIIAEAEGTSVEAIRASERRARDLPTTAAKSEESEMNRARERCAAAMRDAREILVSFLPRTVHGDDMGASVSMLDEAIALIHTFPWTPGVPESLATQEIAPEPEDETILPF